MPQQPDRHRARLHEAQPSDAWQSFWDEIARLGELSRTATSVTAAQQYENYSNEHLDTFTSRLLDKGFQADAFRIGAVHESPYVRGHIAGRLNYVYQHDPSLGATLAEQLLIDNAPLVRKAAIEALEHYLAPKDSGLRPSTEENEVVLGILAAGAAAMSDALGELEGSIERHPSNG